ncbi:MAG: GDP-mannose 4,6-dehydratase [Flavobacteriales bacterium AspAUS03]
MINILVTGGSGFIGSHLCKALLQAGHLVINVDNFDDFYDHRIKIKNTLESVGKDHISFEWSANKFKNLEAFSQFFDKKNYKFFIQDIRDQEGLEQILEQNIIDIIIHLAALAGVGPSIERPLEYEQVNISGTMHLLELCKKYNIKKFIGASSSSVYGNNEKVPFSEEDSVDRAISPYGATKKCCEVIGHVYHYLYNIDVIMLRFFTVYGPGQRPDLAIHKFARLITEGQEIPFFGDGTTARDYTYVDDIVEGIMGSLNYVMNHGEIYEIINLGNHQPITLNEMVGTLENALKIKAKINLLPLPTGDVLTTYADISKAQRLIDFAPKTDFEQGICNFINWFREKDEKDNIIHLT